MRTLSSFEVNRVGFTECLPSIPYYFHCIIFMRTWFPSYVGKLCASSTRLPVEQPPGAQSGMPFKGRRLKIPESKRLETIIHGTRNIDFRETSDGELSVRYLSRRDTIRSDVPGMCRDICALIPLKTWFAWSDSHVSCGHIMRFTRNSSNSLSVLQTSDSLHGNHVVHTKFIEVSVVSTRHRSHSMKILLLTRKVLGFCESERFIE